MPRSEFGRRFKIVTALIVIVILYGSLYPFDFRIPGKGIGPVATLIGSWAEKPGRGDFLSNILLYMPLGYFGYHATDRATGGWRQAILVILLGTMLSISMELTQYYDEGRDTEATDVYSNAIGTILGVVVGLVMGGGFIRRLLQERPLDRVPLMFLGAWTAYRLYPYVPTIDLHKYWNALKPVVLRPSLTGFDLFRHSAIWLTIGTLIEGVVGYRRSARLFPLFAAGVLVAKIFIVDASLSVAEIAGAGVASCVWLAFGWSGRLRIGTAALLLGAYVVALRLEPFHFSEHAGRFGWIPFLSLMQGSIEVDVMSFLEKFFLYGSSIWLLTNLGLKIRTSTMLVAAILFATSWAEIYLPGRSAEITDGLMALLIGVAIANFRVPATDETQAVAIPEIAPIA